MFTLEDQYIAGAIIFVFACFGFTTNSVVAVYTRKLPSMNNAYGRLTGSQAAAEAIFCSVFAFLVAPMVMFDIVFFQSNSGQFGFLLVICYDVCCWSHLFIALNRMIAICVPTKYEIYFSIERTRIMIAISWIVPISTAVILYKVFPCDLLFFDAIYAFIFTQNEVCNFISWNIAFYKDIIAVSIIGAVDCITIYKVHSTLKESQSTCSELQARRRKKEVNFLKQACLQGFFYGVGLLSYFIIASKFENKWIVFSLTTVAWICVITTDALIILYFNKEFRRLITRSFSSIYKVHNAASHEISRTTAQPSTSNAK